MNTTKKEAAANTAVSAHALPEFVHKSQSEIALAMARHDRVALQFSGGKDSLAVLYLLRPYWHRLAVIWSNPGDEYPETREIMEAVRPLVGAFHEVRGNATTQIIWNGFPCDMVPVSATPLGRMVEPSEQRFTLQSRYECCHANFWLPLENAIRSLGINLIICGQRGDERMRNTTLRSGLVDEAGREYLLPLNAWTKENVLAYLDAEGVSIPRQYAYGLSSLDCLHCTGYLMEGGNKLPYLREFHPNAYVEVERRLRLIQSAHAREHRLVQIALGECEGIGDEGRAD